MTKEFHHGKAITINASVRHTRAAQTRVQRQSQRHQKLYAHHILQQETMEYKSPWQSIHHKFFFTWDPGHSIH